MKNTRTVAAWRSPLLNSVEYCSVAGKERGWVLRGLVLLASKHNPTAMAYEVRTDDQFRTRKASVERYEPMSKHRLSI
jgi:hypothetical protein